MNRQLFESLISAILRSRDAALEAGSELEPEALSEEARVIFEISMEALESGVRPEEETIKTHLDARDQLTEPVEDLIDSSLERSIAPRNVGLYIEEINNRHIENEAEKVCMDVQAMIREGEVTGEEALDELESRAFQIGGEGGTSFRPMAEIARSVDQDVQRAINTDGDVVGVPSGLKELDKITAGFQSGKLYIVAARPSMGKSALCGTCVFNGAREDISSAVHLLEMSGEEFTTREAARLARVDSFALSSGRITDGQYKEFKTAKQRIAEMPVWIDDTPGVTVEQIIRKARRLKSREPMDALWIDYLQLMQESGVSSNRNQEIGHITRSLKKAASDLEIPVVLLSQLNRKVENRGGKPIPKLADLRDSGEIEQDADVVIFIYRPEHYGISRDDQGRDTQGIAHLIVSKHRGGPTGTAVVHWNDQYASFDNLTTSYE